MCECSKQLTNEANKDAVLAAVANNPYASTQQISQLYKCYLNPSSSQISIVQPLTSIKSYMEMT
jgi:hypothetical protein